MKQTLKIGITFLVVAALTMSGIALAQTDESTDDTTVNDTAIGKIVERLQGLVDDGTISADQAQAVAEALAEGFPGGRPGHRRGFGEVAEFLGMTQEDFRAALQEYDTLADLAAANGSSGDELIAYLVSQAEEHIAQAVADGKIDQATADEKLAELEDRITEKVNSEIPEPGTREGRPGRRGPGGGDEGGFGAPGTDAAEAGLSA